jgi:hypothetical protein
MEWKGVRPAKKIGVNLGGLLNANSFPKFGGYTQSAMPVGELVLVEAFIGS